MTDTVQPVISVILPTYNRCEVVERTLDASSGRTTRGADRDPGL